MHAKREGIKKVYTRKQKPLRSSASMRLAICRYLALKLVENWPIEFGYDVIVIDYWYSRTGVLGIDVKSA